MGRRILAQLRRNSQRALRCSSEGGGAGKSRAGDGWRFALSSPFSFFLLEWLNFTVVFRNKSVHVQRVSWGAAARGVLDGQVLLVLLRFDAPTRVVGWIAVPLLCLSNLPSRSNKENDEAKRMGYNSQPANVASVRSHNAASIQYGLHEWSKWEVNGKQQILDFPPSRYGRRTSTVLCALCCAYPAGWTREMLMGTWCY